MPFQSAVHSQPAPAFEGDFASLNIWASQLAGPQAFTAGANGLTVGRFCWIDASGLTLSNTGTGIVAGFVHRELQAYITTFLAENTMLIPTGIEVTAMVSGDYWMRTPVAATRGTGLKAFAKTADGTLLVGAAGATVTGAVETAFYIASNAAAGELVKISTHSRGA